MARINTLCDDERMSCFGYGNADASDGILYSSTEDFRIEPCDEKRVLIIGLGGQGFKTVKKIKNKVCATYKNWKNRIAFAAIGDCEYLSNETILSMEEKFIIPFSAGINFRTHYREQRSEFTRSWINPYFHIDFGEEDPQCTWDWINIRQCGRALLFDGTNSTNHTDSKIIEFIKSRASSILEGFVCNSMSLQVNIILGTSGTFGSAGINEIAHFIHRAFDNIRNKLQIFGYFYLPDVVEQYHVDKCSLPRIRANGYAALKELDYYQSVFQREDRDYLYLSTSEEPPYEISRYNRLYDKVYLVSGSNGGGVVNKNKNAIETVSAFIVGQLTEKQKKTDLFAWDWMDDVLAKVGQMRISRIYEIYNYITREELPGECGEDSFNYNAIGVATAAIPEQTIKMYAISKLLKTVLGKEDGFMSSIPFKGLGIDYLTPAETEPFVNQILSLTPLKAEAKIRYLVDEALQWRGNLDFFLTRDVIVDHSKHDTCRACLRQWRPYEECRYKLIEQINQWIDTEYAVTLDTIFAFIRQEGLKAFIDMYDGVTADGQRYESLHSLVIRSLSSFIEEYRLMNMSSIGCEETARNLNMVEEHIAAPIGMIFFKKFQQEWLNAFRDNEIESITLKIAKEHVFGEHGVYWSHYLAKIDTMAEEIKTFYYTLEQLSSAYDSMGKHFESYEDFLNAAKEECLTNINIVASETDYNWAKQIVDRHAENIAFTKVKNDIIDSFMENPKQWIEFDSACPDMTPRRVMDKIVADQVQYDEGLSVITLIQHKLDDGIPIDTICKELVASLSVKAEPLVNIKPQYISQTRSAEHKILIAPNALIYDGVTGYNLKKSIETACWSSNITPYFSNNVQTIECYSITTAIPLYSLADLQTWEAAYENPSNRTFVHSNESGKGIYDPEKGLAWVNYPSLCLRQDPRLPDPQGKVSREGEFFKNVIDPMFADAMKKGIIVEETSEAGGKKLFSYSCYLLDNPGWDYKIDFDEYAVGEDGLYPTDDRLYAYFARKNHGQMENIKKPIRLLEQGKFNEPHADRKIAMDRAKRALRRNVPLFVALRKTLGKFDDVTADIRAANTAFLQKQVGTLIPYYIASGLLHQSKQYRWMLNNYPILGLQTEILRTDPFAMSGNKYYAKGFKYLVLWKAFMDKTSADPQIQTIWQQAFADMTSDPASYVDDFLNRLRPFKEEADDFVAKYDGSIPTNTGARQVLRRDLAVDADGLDEMLTRYLRVIEVYNQIADY